jgi:hypothetical protein
MRGSASGVVSVGLGLGHNLINALLGIGLADASVRCDYLRYVSAIARWDVCIFAEIRLPQPFATKLS